MTEPIFEKKGLTKKSENISEWYHDVVLRAELAEYSDVRGCMIIRPLGYALWESVQGTLDGWFKLYGVQNVYFPMFIPMNLFQKEKEHVEGFSPELAVVTHGGGEELAEPLALRPTSEVVITQKFADWVHSHRDLPLLVNQWCNVVRWEKRTYPFLRTSEFLWQEGHTVHATKEDAMNMVLAALGWYQKFYEEYFAISPYVGIKSQGQKFAGADMTYTMEQVAPDGKALQAATSHYLGEHFTKPFGVEFSNEEGKTQNPVQTSWGTSTRTIGGLVLAHGDDSGLVLPPRVAPMQVVVLAIGNKSSDVSDVHKHAASLVAELKEAGVRAALDADFVHSLGFRINTYELKGVPLRLEVGPKDMAGGTVLSVRRDTFTKEPLSRVGIADRVGTMLERIQNDLLKKSQQAKEDMTIDVEDYEVFKETMAQGKKFIRILWCEAQDCELKVKEETKATPRVLEMERLEENIPGSCVACGASAHRHWLFAQSY